MSYPKKLSSDFILLKAQDALSQIERLKGLLEESASWEGMLPMTISGSAAPQPGSTPTAQAADAPGSDPATAAALRLRALHTALLEEKAKSADLELGMRALAAELVRAQHASVSIGRSVLPALSSIEHRLGGMCRKAHCQVEEALSLNSAQSGASASLQSLLPKRPHQQHLLIQNVMSK
jgi:hypothetical protein